MSNVRDETDGIRLSALEEDILTLMGTQKMYGLEILDGLNQGRPISIGFGSLYPTLNRLEKKGLVSWKWGSDQDETGGARRKYYIITGSGQAVLREVQNYRDQLKMRSMTGQAGLAGA
ncbi:MAG: PadR family transcriptional regulator [Nostoc sp. ChiQUE02]|uniref:PadR family transcriptional regulator n=1 Tax=Nostoc sp. ChiQUE02 TaxID=3075377 RepID=UPI002AD2C3D7|nr:PadR family transcriptional regulator [Nostoc sp. ChiQUE02]MDZ8232926.1 PadR family transcriptional regulator [Nostoc sp. ChiQUE02]